MCPVKINIQHCLHKYIYFKISFKKKRKKRKKGNCPQSQAPIKKAPQPTFGLRPTSWETLHEPLCLMMPLFFFFIPPKTCQSWCHQICIFYSLCFLLIPAPFLSKSQFFCWHLKSHRCVTVTRLNESSRKNIMARAAAAAGCCCMQQSRPVRNSTKPNVWLILDHF